MENLLIETLRVLELHGLTPNDVRWIGNEDYWSTWENFKELADFDYDGGYGSAHVAQDLIIAGDDWWMTRGEYDGSEWWDFHRKPALPENYTKFICLGGNQYMWEPLSKYNPHIKKKREDDDE